MPAAPPSGSSNALATDYDSTVKSDAAVHAPPRSSRVQEPVATAIVYCEANFADIDGKDR